jgi:LSD1 subclass zinc finger protein
MDNFNEPKHRVNQQLSCNNCGAILKFAPGTHAIACPYCNTQNEIEQQSEEVKQEAIQEIDYLSFLKHNKDSSQKMQVSTVKCPSCAAVSTLKPNVTSDVCAFCGTSLVLDKASISTIIKPKALLPFALDHKKGMEAFKNWLSGLWFAPNNLTRIARHSEALKGMYLPYWTYDADTYSSYTGERGDDYTETETYTDSNGDTQTRQVTRTRWYYVSGNVQNLFDDVTVIASNSLPREYAQALDPWDLENLVPYDEKFLSGFQAEAYQVELEQGFDYAKGIMDGEIRSTINRDIGGDHQRIHSLNTEYDNITFKHILLPIWISSYKYGDKIYRFLVNARTGEVQGERPYSWIKIALAVLAGIIVVGLMFYLFGGAK